MSPKSYLQHETPSKNYLVIRELITAVFHLLLLLLLQLPQCLGATSGIFHISILFPGAAPREAVPRGQIWSNCCMQWHIPIAILCKKKSNYSTTVKAEFLVKEKRILNLIGELLWPLPWIAFWGACNSFFLNF